MRDGIQAGEEEQDEFLEFYNQYRPGFISHNGHINTTNNGFNLAHNSVVSRSQRNSVSAPRSWGSAAISESGSASSFGSGYSSFTTGSGPSFTQGHGQGVKNRFLPRSRSHGRDPRMTDIMKTYHSSRPELYPQPEDSISRDSGNSSGGTPEQGRKGIVRHNSFPQGEIQTHQVTRAQVYETGTGAHTYGNRGNPLREEDWQKSYQPDYMTNYQKEVDSYTNRDYSKARCRDGDWGDSISLFAGGGETAHPGGARHTHLDSISLRSLDSHLLNWSPLAEEFRPKITAKRKFDSFNDNNSIVAEDEVQPKRPRTPRPPSPAPPSSWESFKSLLRRVCIIILVLVSAVSILMLGILSLASYRTYQCGLQRSHPLPLPSLAKLQGQHLAKKELLSAFTSFSTTSSSSPVMVLLLLGWLGSGKTYAAKMVASVFPVQTNLHSFHGSLPSLSVSDLPSIITKSCGHSFILMDDLDPGDEVTMARLERLVLTLSNTQDSKSNGTLIVVTSTAGGQNINQYMLERAKIEMGWRERVSIEEIFEVLKEETLPIYSSLRKHGVPVRLVPFLPLTREHVRKCIHQELGQAGAAMNTDEVTSLLEQLQFFSKEFPVFAQTGCKQVASRVGLALGGRTEL